jgi:hypothetical protein
MLLAMPPVQPAVPLTQVAIVEKVPTRVRPWSPFHKRPRVALRRRRPRGGGPGRSAGRSVDSGSGAFHPAMASWYGGGGTLACGGTLTSSTLGVANKTLPCGTWIDLRYRGRSLQVQVIDRGPFVAGREFDLTEATKRALGFGDLGEVWWRLS